MSDDTKEELARLDVQLRDLLAEREKRQAAREARDVLAAARSRVAEAERDLRDEAAIDKAVEEHGEIGVGVAAVKTRLGVVIVKRPNHLHFKRFQDKGSTKYADLEQLVRTCVVYPERAALDALLEELPATLVHLADAAIELVGTRTEKLAGKS